MSRRRLLSKAAAGVAVGAAGITTAHTSARSVPAVLRLAQQPKTVTMWTSFTGEVEVSAIQAIADDFNKSQSEAAVEVVQVPSQSESDVTKLMTAVRGGVGPDVYLFNRPFASQRAADGVLQDLTPFLEGSDISGEYLEFAFKECQFQDQLFALPFDTDARALYYRKDILQEVGIDAAELDPANGPVTVARIREMAGKIDKKDANGAYTRMGFVPWFAQGWHYTWGYDFGGSFYSPEECKITATNEGVVAGLNYLYEEAAALGPEQAQAFMSSVNRPDAPPAQNPFITGAIAFMVSGDWEIANMKRYAPDVDYGITYIPVPKEGDNPSSWSAGFSLVMPQGAKEPEAAFQFMRHMGGEAGQRIYTKATQHFPTIKALLEEKDLYDERHLFFNEILKFSTSLPTVPVGALLWDELTTAQEKVTLNQATAEDALNQVQSRVQQQMDRYC
jgi:multiple sugar transport system substrate-binding protein